MTTHPVMPPGGHTPLGPTYALIPVHGPAIVTAIIARMLDTDGHGGTARMLQAGEPVPMGARPVLIADTTVYAAVCLERMLRVWDFRIPRPWLVLAADVPAPPAPAARYRIRALQARLAGIARLPYLPSLRIAEGPEAAMEHKDVQKAAAVLRRQLEGK